MLNGILFFTYGVSGKYLEDFRRGNATVSLLCLRAGVPRFHVQSTYHSAKVEPLALGSWSALLACYDSVELQPELCGIRGRSSPIRFSTRITTW